MKPQQNVTLEKPSLIYQDAYYDLLEEYTRSEEALIPWVLKFESSPFDRLVNMLFEMEHGRSLPPGYVPSSTFWLVENKRRILGVTNIRHYLTDTLRRIGGHIGYGIRPSERKKGYATIMLRMALQEARALGITRALLTCNKTNIASARVMLNNGAVLDSEYIVDGRETQRYWIPLTSVD